jgi:hypothetical protein
MLMFWILKNKVNINLTWRQPVGLFILRKKGRQYQTIKNNCYVDEKEIDFQAIFLY